MPDLVSKGNEMIQCTPKGLCSWDYHLTLGDKQAENSIDWMKEEGSIIMDGVYLPVVKHGVLSGHWSLEHDGTKLAQAFKESAFNRTFKVQAADYHYNVRATSAFKREMIVEEGGKTIALIRPVHSFTRRATIQVFTEDCDFATLAFIFWLVQLVWKRNAGSGS